MSAPAPLSGPHLIYTGTNRDTFGHLLTAPLPAVAWPFLKTLAPRTRGYLLCVGITRIDEHGHECLTGGSHDPTGDELDVRVCPPAHCGASLSAAPDAPLPLAAQAFVDAADKVLLIRLGLIGLDGPTATTVGGVSGHLVVDTDRFAAFVSSLAPAARAFLEGSGVLSPSGQLRPFDRFNPLLSTLSPESALFTPAQWDLMRDFGLAQPCGAELSGRVRLVGGAIVESE